MRWLLAEPMSFSLLLFAFMSLPSLRQRLLQGGGYCSYGTFLMSDSPVVAEMLALTGYDHIVIDHEHSSTDARSGQQILQAIDAARFFLSSSPGTVQTTPIVRLPSPHDPVYMKKVLDSLRLPAGVLVPLVDDAETAATVVRSTRYPTGRTGGRSEDGIRGCAATLVRGSGWGLANDQESYLKQCREDLLVMVQVETPAGIEAIPEIAKVEGLDGIFIGPLDLSASIGKMGQFNDPKVKELINKAEKAVLDSCCLLAGFRRPDKSVKEMFDTGYRLVSGSADMALLRDAAHRDCAAGNEAAASDAASSAKRS